MAAIRWIYALPCAGLVGIGVGAKYLGQPPVQVAADGRIVTPKTAPFEQRMGMHVYGPTWLPAGARPRPEGPMKGDHRILEAFVEADGTPMFIVSQEAWTSKREAYLVREFQKRSDAEAKIGEASAFFSRGSFGERRLYWKNSDAAVIVSSSRLPDEEILKIARSVR